MCILCATIRLRGIVDTRRLETAIRTLVNRHKSLRTVFVASPTGPVQRVLKGEDVSIVFEDHALVNEEEKKHQMQQCVEQELGCGFNISSAPPTRFRVLSFDSGDHALLVATHHVVADVWSMKVIARDLAAIYDLLDADSMDLPDLAFDYLDFAEFQRRVWLC